MYLLERTEEDEPSVRRLGFAEAVVVITEHGFHLANEPGTITRQAFEKTSALGAAVPVWGMACPRGLDRIDRTRALLEALDATDG